ncbi:cyclic nucleotide-binding domain-containing protein [bacterium]|nr:cyclic nucleotide-binding domain-containing protein [bacterium]
MSTKFIDPRTGKVVEFGNQTQRKFVTLEHNVLDVDDLVVEGVLEDSQDEPQILSKKFVTTSQFIEHIVLLLKRRQMEEACDIYTHSQEDIGYLLINRLSGDDSELKILANMFYKSRDFMKAALVCEKIGAYDKAADLYEKSDDYFMAAESYLKVGKFERAAEMYEKNGHHLEAAQLFTKISHFERAAFNYEKAVNVFLAGKLYFEIGNFKKSMELLQKIEPQQEHFLEATNMIASILVQNGYTDLAIRKYESIKNSVGINEDTECIYFELVKLYLQKNDIENGKSVLIELRNYNLYYPQSELIMQELKQGINRFLDLTEEIEIEIDFGSDSLEKLANESSSDIKDEGYISVMEGFEHFSTMPIFSELSLEELKSLYNISETVHFPKGEYIIKQNQPGEGLFIIRAGEIDILDESDGVSTLIVSLKDGTPVGEMSLVDDSKTSASVKAKTDVLAFKIPKTSFSKLLAGNDRISRKIYLVFIKILSERLRKTNEKLHQKK